ncbi:acetyltransferase [Pontibacter sp. MBLB2868]|uniref:acetyltransferase n=1 Tax=Pontibacter sp. MBLB2868 TaxID=3451555 RepID=UPI003F74C9F3
MIIYGASGHGKVIAEILERNGVTDLVFVDDKPGGETFLGYPLHHTSMLPELGDQEVIIAVGNNRTRKKIADSLEKAYRIAMHPSAQISPRCKPGAGTVVMAGVVVNADSRIGEHVILNTNCSIDHDCVLEDYVHISPNVALAGNVTVGEGTQVGIGSSVIQGIKIGNYATIGAGAAIIEDVPDFAVVVGVPGKVIKYTNPLD